MPFKSIPGSEKKGKTSCAIKHIFVTTVNLGDMTTDMTLNILTNNHNL